MRVSEHLRLEVAAALHRGRPLDPGEAVPGCSCPDCTGIPADAPARRQTTRRPRRDLRPALDVDAARAVPILAVAARLGIEVNRAGWALCFNHADRSPSLHVNAKKNRVYCNPCSRSWDGIQLVMEFKKIEFVDAVKELAA